ncbi:MAG: class I SAM-dependent methyltransferase [Deltaproteobacteria bacterium]|nr:class I SAM-dependent methyltransferase [Deltaproteobacteria bacterium]
MSPGFSSTEYWEKRYKEGGNSGAGSYGRLAAFKAEVINKFIVEREIGKVMEFGCGDGNQLSLLKIKKYIGYDVSPTTIANLKRKFKDEARKKSFYLVSNYDGGRAELILSLDVIFHLVEDAVFEEYMTRLFKAGEKYVIIYSSDQEPQEVMAPHFRHRQFSKWVTQNCPTWKLIEEIKNPYSFDQAAPNETSTADFKIYALS